MNKRFVAVVSTAILLIAGMLSSAVCEMTCLPQAQNGTCCSQQMQQTVHLDHCGHTGAGAVMNGHQCAHPQDSPATATADASVIQVHAIHSAGTALPALNAKTSIVGMRNLPGTAVLKRASIIPLRI